MITAGGTCEAIDPVYFIDNHSSGHQGYTPVEVAAQHDAQATVVAGHIDQPATPLGATVVKIDSTLEMAKAAYKHAKLADVCIFVATTAGSRLVSVAGFRMKKGVADGTLSSIQLTENPDVLAIIAQCR